MSKSPDHRGHNAFRLTAEILKLSQADTWDRAKLEWSLEDIYPGKPRRCLCGHFPIIQHCVIVNRENDERKVVGSVCVTKFIGLTAEKLFTSIGRVMKDRTKALNAETVEYAWQRGWINYWERDFYLNTLRIPWAGTITQRGLWPKQQACRVRINEKVVARFMAQGGRQTDD